MLESVKLSSNKKMTIGDIAKELGLSKTTVSRAISGKGRVSEDTRRRVLAYIELHDYRPNVIARGLASSKTYNIAVVLPADSNVVETPFFQGCLMGICEVAASRDYDVVVTTIVANDISLLERIISNRKVDGVILTRLYLRDLSVEYLKKQQIPFLVIGTSGDDDVIQVDNAHAMGCQEMTSLLLSKGIKSIALLVGNQEYVVNQNRRQGFINGCEKQGLPSESAKIYENVNTKALIETIVEELIKEKTECIVCADDLLCSRVISVLDERGYTVPDDIKIASFYNSTLLESHHPSISTIKIDVKELGRMAGRKLIDMLQGVEVESKTLSSHEIVLKKSTQ